MAEHFQISANQRDDINILNGKIRAVGSLLQFTEPDELPRPDALYENCASILLDASFRIAEITDAIERAEMEIERTRQT